MKLIMVGPEISQSQVRLSTHCARESRQPSSGHMSTIGADARLDVSAEYTHRNQLVSGADRLEPTSG